MTYAESVLVFPSVEECRESGNRRCLVPRGRGRARSVAVPFNNVDEFYRRKTARFSLFVAMVWQLKGKRQRIEVVERGVAIVMFSLCRVHIQLKLP